MFTLNPKCLATPTLPSKINFLLQLTNIHFQNLLSEADVINKVRLLSCLRTHANYNAWVRALPSDENKFTNQERVIIMKRWYLL